MARYSLGFTFEAEDADVLDPTMRTWLAEYLARRLYLDALGQIARMLSMQAAGARPVPIEPLADPNVCP